RERSGAGAGGLRGPRTAVHRAVRADRDTGGHGADRVRRDAMAAVSADESHRPRGAAAVPALPERPALAPGPGGRPAAAGVRGGHGARELRRAAQRQPAQSAPAEPVHRPAAAHLAVRGPAGGAAAGELRDLRPGRGAGAVPGAGRDGAGPGDRTSTPPPSPGRLAAGRGGAAGGPAARRLADHVRVRDGDAHLQHHLRCGSGAVPALLALGAGMVLLWLGVGAAGGSPYALVLPALVLLVFSAGFLLPGFFSMLPAFLFSQTGGVLMSVVATGTGAAIGLAMLVHTAVQRTVSSRARSRLAHPSAP